MARSSPKRPDNAETVSTYAELDRFVRAWVDRRLSLLILIGAAGLQKTRTFRATVGPEVCWLDSNVSPFGLYCQLFEHRNKPVVIDDVDSLYAEPTSVKLLKSLCQTEPRKTISWHTLTTVAPDRGIPAQFTTTSQVAIIANTWTTLNANVGALEDRGHVVFFEPDAEEVHRRVGEWFAEEHPEIYDFIGAHLHLITRPSMRHYHLAREKKDADLDWRKWLFQVWHKGPEVKVAQLLADPSFADKSEEERIRAFIASGAGCRATYFNHKRKLRPRRKERN